MSDFSPDPAEPASNQAEFTVSELSAALKRTVEDAYGYVRVRGEISGFKRAASGHLYMTLKDDKAVIDGVCWRGVAGRLMTQPEDGLEVIATGKVTTYAARSKYQIVIDQMEVAGEGALLKLLEERRKKLAAEGLFDADRKQALPYLPARIGVVTSPTGAVIRDILHRLNDRFPRHVLLWPVLVQGEDAARQVADAITEFNALTEDGPVPRPDLLIVARGGGSLEDLWTFNEEIVVRAAAASEIPLISAVGHETDTTLIDYASDQRAPTPTAAAEMAVPVRAELQAAMMDLGRRQLAAMTRLVDEHRIRLEGLGRGLPDLATLLAGHNQRLDSAIERLGRSGARLVTDYQDRVALLGRQIKPPRQTIGDGTRRLAREAEALGQAMMRTISTRRDRLKAAGDLLESVSFRRIVERGYTVIWDRDGKPVTSAAAATTGKQVTIEFADGKRDAAITGGDAATAKPKPKREKSPDKEDKRQGELL